MSEKPNDAPDGELWKKGFAVLLAVIVILSIVLALVYFQMKDYHDAKYRAQYCIVVGMTSDLHLLAFSLDQIASNSTPDDTRDVAVLTEQTRLRDLDFSARTISTMYLNDNEKSLVFNGLANAFVHVQATLGSYLGKWQNSTGWMAEARSLEENTTALEVELGNGVDNNRDPLDDPYSLVDRMDLKKIDQIATMLQA